MFTVFSNAICYKARQQICCLIFIYVISPVCMLPIGTKSAESGKTTEKQGRECDPT